MFREYEADLRYLEERYPTDTEDDILEQITDKQGKLDKKLVKEYVEKQLREIEDEQRQRREFFEEVKRARNRGCSNREIWGDDDHVSYPQMSQLIERRASSNIDLCIEICHNHNVSMKIEETQITKHSVEVYDI